jgi:radical SAM-linked protein
MQRLRIKYTKEGPVKFIGHLDFIKIFEKAMRRTNLPVAYSQGFNPRMQLSWGPPLALGITSDCEIADFYFETWVNPGRVKEELNKVLPPGIRILEATLAHPTLPSASSGIKASEYVFELKDAAGIQEKIDEIMAKKSIVQKRISKGKEKDIDLRPMIYSLEISGPNLKAVIQTSEKGSLKPAEFLELLGNPSVIRVKRSQILVDGLRPL